jgi:hypothetical protein
MTESIVCRTERANPAQSIALLLKGFGRFCAKKLQDVNKFFSNLIVKGKIHGNIFVNITVA